MLKKSVMNQFIELLIETEYLTSEMTESLLEDANSILKMIKSAIITTKNSLKKK